ncbi:DNA-binding transcriptional regulator, MerR family [Lacrimispora sphenoides]|jgi:DNA-binding transcriptional MerR regulator|uniref:MerR family transcriptional regulator n=1 Tax=Lacrimispora sphenoides TaxID=29370 RepID=UPI0008B27F5A|nr:MerR family transcriptional regulator [Lacrimispora sphenoides]SEU05429.1 DNA-binding transcriptional regulator, MerR family [Lacrimispora sphenoides]
MYSMKEVCKRAGMTYETLKYYCNEGLIPNVKRDKHNYRIFDDRDIAWIKSLSCLKQCGMGITEMKQYVELCLKGKSSITERKIILEQKRKALLEKLQELNECIEYIDTKQQFYDDVLNNKIKYVSNLINVDESQ